jgi:hypothetical protein
MGKRTGNPRGRPPGSKNKPKSQVVIAETAKERAKQRAAAICLAIPETPLEVMLDNMRWSRIEAAVELQAIFEKAKAEGDAKTQLAAFKELRALRMLSNDFADRAARYCHAPPKPKDEARSAEPPMKLINPFAHDQAEIFKRFGAKPKEREN